MNTYKQQAKLDHTIRELIHFVEGPCNRFGTGLLKETLPPGSPKPTSVIWWTSTEKTIRIFEHLLSYTGNDVTGESWTMYDVDGVTVLSQISDVIEYQAGREATRVRTAVVMP